jgi:hypothetical protein
LKLDILPFHDYCLDASLVLLREAGFVSQYTGSDGKLYGEVTNFCKHQRINGKEAQEPARFPMKQPGSIREATEKQQRSQERERERSMGKGDEKLPPQTDQDPPLVIPPNETLAVDETPGGLHPNQYATRLLEEIRFPVVASNIRAVAAAIECESKVMGLVAAYEFVLECTRFAIFEEHEINSFFFTDGKYRPERRNGNGGRQVSAAAQRTSNTRRGLIDAVRNLAAEADRRNGAERKNGT